MPVPTRVLIVGSPRPDSPARCYERALAGHYQVRLVSCEWPAGLPGWTQRGLDLVSRATLAEPLALALPRIERAARELAPEIVLVTETELLPERTLDAVRRAGPDTRIVGCFSGSMGDMGRGYFFAADYDALFFRDRFIVEKLRKKLGWRHIWLLPGACDPHATAASDGSESNDCDVIVCGKPHYFRAELLKVLRGHGLRVRLIGPRPRWLEHANDDEFFELGDLGPMARSAALRRAHLVLNVDHLATVTGCNEATFEVAAMNLFQLTDAPGLADFFDPEREVAQFRSSADMLAKVTHYLARPEERRAMAARARQRAMSSHTYAHRWAANMLTLGVPLPAAFPVQASDVTVKAE